SSAVTLRRDVAVRGLTSERHGQQGEEEGAEDDLDPEPEPGDEQGCLVRSPQRAEAVRRPFSRDCYEPDDRHEHKRASDDQAALEAEVTAETFEQDIPLTDPD